MRLPGVCISCREPVVWTGKRWRAPGQYGQTHRCAVACGTWMPQADARCGRKPGHRWEHRSRYALDNQARARAGSVQ